MEADVSYQCVPMRTGCYRRKGEEGALSQCCWECKSVLPFWRTRWKVLKKKKKLKIEAPYGPALIAGCISKGGGPVCQRDVGTPMYTTAIAKKWKEASVHHMTTESLALKHNGQ